MSKNINLQDKNGVQLFPATTAEQVYYDGSINVKQAIQRIHGSPLVASTVSEMTDTSRVYVYIGSETGYTTGNWYYYNGSAWTSGGVYNAVAVQTDATLSVSGMAADAGAVGDYIKAIIQKANYTFTVNAGGSLTRKPFDSVELNAGTYHVSCYQDVSLTSADRNRFYYQRTDIAGSSVYELSENLAEGTHTWTFTITESGTYSIYIWIVNPSAKVVVSNFALSEMTLRQCADSIYDLQSDLQGIDADLMHQENALALNGIVCFVNDAKPTFTKSDWTYNITFPSATTIVSYIKSDTRYRIWIYATTPSDPISVPDASILYFDAKNMEYGVYTGAEVDIDLTNKQYIVLLFNTRGNLYGQWARYIDRIELDAMQSDISALQDADRVLPEYYDTYIKGKITEINTNILNISTGDAFVFLTDLHIDGNTMHSSALTNEILKNCAINKVFLNGDYIQQEATAVAAIDKINKVIYAYNYDHVRTFVAVGNHDYNTTGSYTPVDALTWQQLARSFRCHDNKNITYQSNGLGYAYIDEINKIKYIVATMNSASGMEAASVNFAASETANTPSGYTIVFMNHGGIRSDLTYQSGFDQLVSLFDAVRNHGSVTINTVTYDFTNADYIVACMIVGHYHEDFSKITDSGMPIIAVTTDAYLYDSTGTVRTVGTTSEQAFDVFCINSDDQTINTVRIGAGSNRSFSYALSTS